MTTLDALLKKVRQAVDYHQLGYGPSGEFNANTMLAIMDRLTTMLDDYEAGPVNSGETPLPNQDAQEAPK